MNISIRLFNQYFNISPIFFFEIPLFVRTLLLPASVMRSWIAPVFCTLHFSAGRLAWMDFTDGRVLLTNKSKCRWFRMILSSTLNGILQKRTIHYWKQILVFTLFCSAVTSEDTATETCRCVTCNGTVTWFTGKISYLTMGNFIQWGNCTSAAFMTTVPDDSLYTGREGANTTSDDLYSHRKWHPKKSMAETLRRLT